MNKYNKEEIDSFIRKENKRIRNNLSIEKIPADLLYDFQTEMDLDNLYAEGYLEYLLKESYIEDEKQFIESFKLPDLINLGFVFTEGAINNYLNNSFQGTQPFVVNEMFTSILKERIEKDCIKYT